MSVANPTATAPAATARIVVIAYLCIVELVKQRACARQQLLR
jgi:hypothetical protein